MENTITKQCTSCLQDKPLHLFRSRGGDQRHLLKSRCNSCLYSQHREWVENNADKVREYREKDSWTLAKRCARRGITPEELVHKYEEQEESCAICYSHISLSDSAIDHNHKTGEFRGVLCKQCNRALGMFKDSPKILKNALEYLNDFGHYGEN
jgi:hypothetical protein